jgi:hypothetical protein
MFEKFGRLAEETASKVGESRRRFLGRLGQAALAGAAALGGVLLLPGSARAGHCYCYYNCNGQLTLKSVRNCLQCSPTFHGCPLVGCNCGA